MTYRQEVVEPLFNRLKAGDSCVVVGPASMGKSRLLSFLLRLEVRQHYLQSKEAAAAMLFLQADCNRLNQLSEWGLYELLLTAIIEGLSAHPAVRSVFNEELRQPVILNKGNELLALRHLEQAVHSLTNEMNLKLCFLLDEFDEAYHILPPLAFANLRAMRDLNKYRLSYILFMRHTPDALRSPDDVEGFYELFSRYLVGLGPYQEQDLRQMLQQLEARHGDKLMEPVRVALMRLSGGHPGLTSTLFDLAVKNYQPFVQADGGLSLVSDPLVVEECRKLWRGFLEPEQQALVGLAHGTPPSPEMQKQLALKGLVKDGAIFSPLLAAYARRVTLEPSAKLRLDESTRTVTVGGRMIDELPPLEFKLLAYLYRHAGQVCRKPDIYTSLHTGEQTAAGSPDIHLEELVRRVRDAIEPDPATPVYLFSVRGAGYRLVLRPE
jgi:hypothetical protein